MRVFIVKLTITILYHVTHHIIYEGLLAQSIMADLIVSRSYFE